MVLVGIIKLLLFLGINELIINEEDTVDLFAAL